jgi:DNA topoisomerase-1
VLAAQALKELNAFTSQSQASRNIIKTIDAVAGVPGNTRAVCRGCYVHPAIVEAYLDRTLAEALTMRSGSRAIAAQGLSRTETAVLALPQRRLRKDTRKPA